MSSFWPFVLTLLTVAPCLEAFSFSFSNKPTQCANTTITVDGGTPPYRLLMVPAGPLVGRPEIRTIVDQEFNSSTFTLPPLAFPGYSNFTAVMGDATGVGTGGTSLITDVADSSDTSCLSTTPTTPLFYLELPADPTLVQCGSIEITFSDSAQGDVELIGLIPGGTSFSIPVPSGARSTNWSPITVVAGTGVMLVAGDARGRGTGGSSYILPVQNGSGACLYASGGGGGSSAAPTVYSSTNAPYAGGQYATGSGGGTVTGPWPTNGSSNSSGSSQNNTPIIVGAVLGVLVFFALALIALLLWRRRHTQRARRYGGTKEVDLLNADRPVPVTASDGYRLEPTPYYTPPRQSFQNNSSSNNRTSTPPTTGHRPSTSTSTMDHPTTPSITSQHPLLVPPSAWNPDLFAAGTGGHRSSTHYLSTAPYSDVPGTEVGGEHTLPHPSPTPGRQEMSKSVEGPGRLRPLNIVEHEDAGGVLDVPVHPGEEEVIELPPSYNAVRQAAGEAHTAN